jgi:uncharacterized protein
MTTRYVLLGILFGFLLSRVGATEYDAIAGMFRLTDLHLVGVIGVAIALNAAGFALIRRYRIESRTGSPIELSPKPMTRGVVVGGLLFGAGWAISGTCPGTALAQIGEGKLAALATFAGILLGAQLHAIRSRPAAPSGRPRDEQPAIVPRLGGRAG